MSHFSLDTSCFGVAILKSHYWFSSMTVKLLPKVLHPLQHFVVLDLLSWKESFCCSFSFMGIFDLLFCSATTVSHHTPADYNSLLHSALLIVMKKRSYNHSLKSWSPSLLGFKDYNMLTFFCVFFQKLADSAPCGLPKFFWLISKQYCSNPNALLSHRSYSIVARQFRGL